MPAHPKNPGPNVSRETGHAKTSKRCRFLGTGSGCFATSEAVQPEPAADRLTYFGGIDLSNKKEANTASRTFFLESPGQLASAKRL